MKQDFKKLDCYQAAHNTFRVLEVPPLSYLMVDGHGDPNTEPGYADAIAALFPVAYSLKFACKRTLDRDFVVMPLEALWWADDMSSFTTARDKSRWQWTAMIMVPEWIDRGMFDAAVHSAAMKKNPVRIGDVTMQTLSEGLCVQTLHIGPYDDEASVLAELHHEYLPGAGLTTTGRHHEIYLSDSRRVSPEKLRTILRQPVIRSADPAAL